MTEATAVTPEGRISPDDLGIWKDEHVEPLARIVRFIKAQGGIAGVQLAHAGRKASTHKPWAGGGTVAPADGGWEPMAPGTTPFMQGYPTPRAMSLDDIAQVTQAFAAGAQRSLDAGFEVIELHAAHGYLLHEFLSPLSNPRTDAYGGAFDNRIRFTLETIAAIRQVWPDRLPLFLRISSTDWTPGGWDLEQSIELARRVKPMGVDLIDCSSGGNVPGVKIPLGPGYQTMFAERIRREADILTGAVGLITTATQADHIVCTGQADAVFVAREFLRDPYFPLRAARELGQDITWPSQYLRAGPTGAAPRVPRL
jgi:2,4-dienoyl-CoA reductase-like NADH-dependent reductase (Old Yellow Enzyme family)